MYTFLLTLHVLAAVFLAGPLAIAPMTGLRALRAGDERGVRDAARTTSMFGLLSLVIAAFGAAVVPTRPDDYTFGTPWLTISMTLYLVTVGLVLLAVVPALRSAAKLLTPEPLIAVERDSGGEAAGEPAKTFAPAGAQTASVHVPPEDQDPVIRAKLDALRGRITASSGIVAALILVITVLMVTKPFSG
jgi:uncharacterized membrane protein